LRFPQQAINFEPGMNLMVAPDDGVNPLRAGGPVTLTGVNVPTGTLTIAGNWNATFPAMANGDYLVAGSASGSDYQVGMHGITAWIPPAAARPAGVLFGVTRAVVYDILKKEKEGDLRDRSWAPKHQPKKTPVEVEDRVVAAKNKTHLGPERLSRYLEEHEGLLVPGGYSISVPRNGQNSLAADSASLVGATLPASNHL
jgi:hypothetical protein